jgi:hypothetical protein
MSMTKMSLFKVKCYDNINCVKETIGEFQTADEAVDCLFKEWNTDKAMEEVEAMEDEEPLYVFELEGKLYVNWVYYGQAEESDLMFRKDWEISLTSCPSNLKELRAWLKAGNKYYFPDGFVEYWIKSPKQQVEPEVEVKSVESPSVEIHSGHFKIDDSGNISKVYPNKRYKINSKGKIKSI